LFSPGVGAASVREARMEVKERAVALFRNGYNCSQAVLGAFAGELGLDEDAAVRLATGFGVGLSQGATCGAVSGAIMVLGLRHGGGGPEGLEAKQATYALAQEFMERFTERMGGTVCAGLLGLDPSTAEGLKEARERGLFEKVCLRAVACAAELVDEVG